MKRYGLIGRTLKHSFSKDYFTRNFIESGRADCVYDNFELSAITDFPQLLTDSPDLKGLNVTIPYKEEVLPYLHQKSDVVQAIGACNCIKIIDGRLTGYNTDVVGFRQSVEPKLKPHHKNALILGTGGAAKAIRYVLSQLNISFQVVSRQKVPGQLSYEDIDAYVLEQHALIINTTPLGMYPNVESAPTIPYDFITPQHFLYDIVYNPAKTKFLAEGEKRGAQTCNGYEMLIGQAEESWRIWTSDL